MRLLFIWGLSFLMAFPLWSQEPNTSVEARKTYEDIKNTLGILPTFLKDYPQEGITGAWEEMKGIQLSTNTRLPGKYKELIGLAVASQIPCRFCVYFHRKAASLHGASEQEMKEAIAVAASSRKWTTFFAGLQTDEGSFRREVDQVLDLQNKKRNRQAMEEKPVVLTMQTPGDAYSDIERTLGMVPNYLRNYPPQGIIGAWKEMKGLELNPATEISGKYKDLISLAVAAQTPSSFGTYLHTQNAIFNGATKEELQETVAMAGVTRQWSTVLNGQHNSETQFYKETDQVMGFLKQKAK